MDTGNYLGSLYLGNGQSQFNVWAPAIEKVDLHIVSPEDQVMPLLKDNRGYHRAIIDDIEPGHQYFYRLDGKNESPDPVSRFQPDGVHGPSQVVDPYFSWDDQSWSGIPLKEYIIYELHVGTFTQTGTFDAIIPYLDELKYLGITAIELMPVGQFPGKRSWGYDGVYPFAVQDSYGGPKGLKRLINTCHQKELAVILDVVYNHLGPEGNHLACFGPYFTDYYRTPWGAALNFDGPYSDDVRHYFIENALYWLEEFHIDALRLDALHAIADTSSYTFIEELASVFHSRALELQRQAYLIGYSAANDARLVRSTDKGGYGLDAQWNDDFHHALHVLLTDEKYGYYQDFNSLDDLVQAYRNGFVYSGQYSQYRQRRHGVPSQDIPAQRFVVFAQNHDHVGNRTGSGRLSQLVSFEAMKLAAGVVLLSPFVPLIFMGEEYGETAPFPYFISHAASGIVAGVSSGRRNEFTGFQWQGEIPDPQDEATFISAKINRRLHNDGQHLVLFGLYQELMRLRRENPALAHLSKETMEIIGYAREGVIYTRCWHDNEEVIIAFNFNHQKVSLVLPFSCGLWHRHLDSGNELWWGEGSVTEERFNSTGELAIALGPWSFALFVKET